MGLWESRAVAEQRFSQEMRQKMIVLLSGVIELPRPVNLGQYPCLIERFLIEHRIAKRHVDRDLFQMMRSRPTGHVYAIHQERRPLETIRMRKRQPLAF